MVILIFIVLLILFIIFAVKLIKNKLILNNVIYRFKKCNVITFGKKSTGKDLVHQYVINKRKDYYYSNIPYGGKFKNITLNDINVEPNTFDNFINNNIVKVKKRLKEKTDIYISDAGIYLPSQYDTLLYKKYKTFPIYYALSRHLYNSNIHVNTQNLDRVWKAIREQADFYIRVKSSKRFLFWIKTDIITYDRYDSAKRELEPLTSRVLNAYSKAQYDVYVATNGEIHKAFIIQPIWKLHYDTRVFHKLVFGKKRK